MLYTTLNNNYFEKENYSIKPISKLDMEAIRNWRNDQKIVLRQRTDISRRSQQEYFDNEILPLFSSSRPSQILFSYYLKESLIGYGGLVHLSWHDYRAEMSFLLDSNRVDDIDKYEKDFSTFIKLITNVCFFELGFNRLFTETYAFRTKHIQILENNGFILEGTLRENVFINGNYIDSMIHGLLKKDYHAK